jgi:type IV secretory pathway VirJ component
VLLTGDGGWAGLDQDLSNELASRGVPVVGLNSLKYFWRARTQEETAEAVARATRHALQRFGKTRVAFIGYSFGADVLPFIVNRLPADLVGRTASVNLLALSQNADFEIKVANWLPNAAAATRGEPVAPEIAKLPSSIPTQCFYGDGEKHDPCTSLPSGRIGQVQIGAGHHFSGDAAGLVGQILKLSATNARTARP